MAILKTGSLAYWDTFAGLIPCKVTRITGPSGKASSEQSVSFTLTAGRGAYRAGENHTESALWVLPRDAVRKGKSSYVILPYTLEGDKPSEPLEPS